MVVSGGIAEASGVLGTAQPVPPMSGETAPLAQAADPTDLAMLGILRRPAQPGDVMSAAAAADIKDNPGGRADGVNPARAVSFGSLGEAWVIPADAGLCLLEAAYANGAAVLQGAECGSDADGHPPYLQGQSGGESAPGTELITGLAPDGVINANLTLTDGTVDVVPVDQNVYMTKVRSGVAATSFANGNGTVTTLPGANQLDPNDPSD